jgi:protease-4
MLQRFAVLLSALLTLFLFGASLVRAEEDPLFNFEDKPAAKTTKKANPKAEKSEPVAKAKPKKSAEKTAKLASIVLSGAMAETAGQGGLFGEIEQDLRKTIERLDKAAQDDTLAGVILKLDEVSLGRGRIDELRAAIGRVRAAGRKVYCRLDSADTAHYLVASACDEIVLPVSGMVALPGVRLEITYYKQLFDRLNIHADFLHEGAFKGAAEPYTREKMSDEVRQNLTGIVNDFYEQMVETIAADRKLSADKVRQLIDRGLFSATAAKEAGLIDEVAYSDEFETGLEKKLGVDELELVVGYGKKKVDTDFSGPAGILKLFQMMLGAEPTSNISNRKKVAIVYAVGEITTGEGGAGMFGGSSLGSDTIIKAIKKAEEDKSVVAIVLRIDSPGGSALASDLMWREIVKCKKPLIASMGDVAASGGYYIAMGTDKIYAEPGTLTGSIGVVGGKIALEGLMKKAGITSEVISRGKNAGLLKGNSPFTDSQREAFQAMLKDTYQQFTTKAAKGRKMEVAQLDKLAGGQVWTGRMAKQNGLVDELGTLRDAVAEAKRRAGLAEDTKIDELVLPEAKNFFESMFDAAEEEEPALKLSDLPLGQLLPTEAQHLGRRVESLLRVFRQPVALVMPFELEIK